MTRVLTLMVLGLFLYPDCLPAQQAGGTIRGKVRILAQGQTVQRARISRYRTSSSTAGSDAAAEAPNVTSSVVYLEGPGLEKLEKKNAAPVLDQRNTTFIPHVLPIVKGTSVRIVNRDKTYHNVFSFSNVRKFNIGRRPTGEEVPVDFEKSGVVQVFCDIHSNMSAFILVLENSAFAQPDTDGQYEMGGIPPGKYTVNAWHERFSCEPRQVTIRAGETVTIDFDLQ